MYGEIVISIFISGIPDMGIFKKRAYASFKGREQIRNSSGNAGVIKTWVLSKIVFSYKISSSIVVLLLLEI